MRDNSSPSEKVLEKQSGLIRQLAYCSEKTLEFTPGSLKDIFDSSKINNAAQSVTGFLLFDGSRFTQVLEGPAEGIIGIYLKKICADKRHSNLRVIHDCFVRRRTFNDWSLAYKYQDGELSNFGGSVNLDRCRILVKALSSRPSKADKMFSKCLEKVCF